MATPEKLLSVKDAEKQDKLDANKEDAKVQEVGGPEPEWSTANYANFKFDAAIGVSPDSSIPTEVDAEKADKLEEAEACPKCGKEPCECESLKEEEGDEEKKDDEKKEVVAEEGEKEDEPKTADELRQDAPAMKVNEADTDEDDADDSDDETLAQGLATRRCHRPLFHHARSVHFAVTNCVDAQPDEIHAPGPLHERVQQRRPFEQRSEAECDQGGHDEHAQRVADDRHHRDEAPPRDRAGNGEEHARSRHQDDECRGDEELDEVVRGRHGGRVQRLYPRGYMISACPRTSSSSVAALPPTSRWN